MERAYAVSSGRARHGTIARRKNDSGMESYQKRKRKIAVFDIETDPFLYGRAPQAFAIGYYDGETYRDFWGDNCIAEFLDFLADQPPCYLYAHNGGRFDFYYIFQWIENPIKIINGRIVSAKIGRHILRDSYAILPVPLSTFGKDVIDYRHFERGERDVYRQEILRYLRRDCTSLRSAVSEFARRFGINLTIGSVAIKELERLHPFERRTESHDVKFRDYYSGGRVECFKSGVVKGKWKIYDVNSMYPFVMKTFNHPTGRDYEFTTSLQEAFGSGKPFFAEIEYEHNPRIRFGALAVKGKDFVSYPGGHVRAFATSHEIRAGIECGAIPLDAYCHGAFVAVETLRFDRFVEFWNAEKIAAGDDVAKRTFAKLILNSAYGKFGSNPAKYRDWHIWRDGEPFPENPEWEVHSDYGFLSVLEKPATNAPRAYLDVATAASITGAARALLFRALCAASRPVYCDTDSIVCENLDAEIHETKLGAWKEEDSGDTILIGGKKLYALKSRGEFVRVKAKGVELTGQEIERIVLGGEIEYRRDAPTFRLGGTTEFLTRRIKSTIRKPSRG